MHFVTFLTVPFSHLTIRPHQPSKACAAWPNLSLQLEVFLKYYGRELVRRPCSTIRLGFNKLAIWMQLVG